MSLSHLHNLEEVWYTMKTNSSPKAIRSLESAPRPPTGYLVSCLSHLRTLQSCGIIPEAMIA